VKLIQSTYSPRVGSAEVGSFFTIYAKFDGVWLAPAWLEGREVIAVFQNRADPKPSYVMWLEWRDGRISFIRLSLCSVCHRRCGAGAGRQAGRWHRAVKLHFALGEAMKRARMGRHLRSHFTPHMTLLYDSRVVPERRIEPVLLKVRDFVLVHSIIDQHQHIGLARLPSRG
jgi:hypothetical protein